MTTAIEPVQEVALQEETGYQLVATDRPQLEAAHTKMIDWAREMQSRVRVEKASEEENLRIASDRKWATTHFKNRIGTLDKRLTFYGKIEQALLAGYVIVPNFEMTVFAIRTKAETPRQEAQVTTWSPNRATAFEQTSQILPAGEGDWQNPIPDIHTEKSVTKNSSGSEVKQFVQWAEEFCEVEFPIALAKPVLMSRTAEAMAAKVFDEIGVARDTFSSRGARRGDPFILGRIRNSRKAPDITFFIGWYFDPTNL